MNDRGATIGFDDDGLEDTGVNVSISCNVCGVLSSIVDTGMLEGWCRAIDECLRKGHEITIR